VVIVTVVVVVLVGMAWSNRSSETWVEVSAQDMRLAVGASGQLSAAFQYKAPFLWHSAARPIAATIQLISFPEAVDVTPTTQVTSDGAPTAVLTVRGLKPGTEELVIAGSDTPRGAESWRTTSLKVFVVKPKP
jgi:hypothetical protein